MITIFMDESGYTGQNLLEPDQPFFVLATLFGTEEDLEKLKTTFFNGIQPTELKYSRFGYFQVGFRDSAPSWS